MFILSNSTLLFRYFYIYTVIFRKFMLVNLVFSRGMMTFGRGQNGRGLVLIYISEQFASIMMMMTSGGADSVTPYRAVNS